MTISELIQALENIKFRNPNAEVRVLECDPDGACATGPLLFGEMDERKIVTNNRIDPMELVDINRPLHTLIIYGGMASDRTGL